MKNKSGRHKEENTFKFQPFSERLSAINIDVFHRVNHVYETESEGNICYFYQDLEKWEILNLTEGFSSFKKEIRGDLLVTLPQLIHNKDHVVETLIKYLKLKDPLYLQPLLSLTASLAKDLRKEFYGYYPLFYKVLLELLETKDTDQLEWVFCCLAYFFKYLWRYLINDITRVFNSLLPLLSENKPEYINNFAAESFAFIARKVKDRKSFLNLLLKAVKNEEEGISGCGKLLFEVIKGVNGQFHSCAGEILTFVFDSLSDPDIPQDVLQEILEYTIAHTVDYIVPEKSEIFWESILTHLNKLCENFKNNINQKSEKDLENLLKLLGQAVEYKSGKLVQQPKFVIKKIVNVLNIQGLPGNIILVIVKISIVILLSSHIRLPQEEASFLVENILSVENEKTLLYFVDNITEFSFFEALILPHFLKFFKINTDYLRVLTNVVLKKAPLCINGIKLKEWSKYPLELRLNDRYQEIESEFLKIIEDDHVNIEQYFCTLICITHINLQDRGKFETSLHHIIDNLLEKCNNNCKNTLFLLNLTVETLLHLNDIEFFEKNFQKFLDNLLACVNESNALYLLNTVSLIIASIKNKTLFTIDVLHGINKYLQPYFNSPYHQLRLLVTFVYSFFEDIPEFVLEHSTDPEVPREKFRIFTICYLIECVDPQINTYRDQILNLEKLHFDKPQMIMCNQTEFKSIPLRYMCGVLYINFQLLWEPTLKVIESHAHGLNISCFWNVYGEQLKKADYYIDNRKDLIIDKADTSYSSLEHLYENWQLYQSKPDFANHRLQLWKGMVLFPDIAEMKTRDVAELLLNFYEKEFTKYNPELALTWNIKQNDSEIHEEILNEDEEKEEDIETVKTDRPVSNNPKNPYKVSSKTKLKTFLQYLAVFSKVKSPKSMYRESELNKLYFDLLQHKNADIQKAALDCLLTYKSKSLIPYKDNLYNLVDDKNFKNELATFNVGREGSDILEEYREHLMSVVIRIVYSKMNAKIGLRTGGRSAGQHRRTLVIRFLGGCHEREKILFMRMVFRYFDEYLDEDFENFDKHVDLEKFVPPKRLQSSINMLNVVLEHFGDSLANELLTKLLSYIHIIGAFVRAAFRRMTNVHVGYHNALKVLRNSSIKLLNLFFEKFQQYQWTTKQINDTFNIFIWPYLEKLNAEGIHSPTVLLKLFMLWGSNPRYFSLLVKHKDDDVNQFILPRVMELLLNKKAHYTVTHAIFEMIEKLLILQPDEEDIKLEIPVDNILSIDQSILDRIKINDKLNYGSCILLPYVPSILSRIQISLERKSKNLNKRELFILSRISELVWEAEISEQTLQLLIPVVVKKCSRHSDEDIVNQFLTSVKNLLQNVSNPTVFLRKISPLFGEVNYHSARKILLSIIDIMDHSNNDLNLKLLKKTLMELNAFDAKWIDQPDFQRRHDAFKEIYTLIQDDKIELQLGILLIYNSYYILNSEKDLSLKENSSRLLKIILPYLLKKYQASRPINDYILETAFNLIRKGMKNRNDDLRNECISLLGHLARKCPENHFILRDLHIFTNEVDPEVDFFENLIHIQIHRHARAMIKFCQILRRQTVMINPQTLTRFILPLASFYLCNDKYASKNSILDAAIETVGVICRLLPWHHYEGLLKFYLSKLRGKINYQKQLVRLTVAILDSFHFDLHKAHKLDIEVINRKEMVEDKANNTLVSTPDEKTNEDIADKEDELIEEENNLEEYVDEVLEKIDVQDEEIEEAEDDVTISNICDKTTVLCKSTATRVIYTIQTILLPQLHKALAEMTHRDTSHKINRKITRYEQEEEDLIKVPLSLAVVKLLQRLPQQILENNLPRIFMKTCTFLKSHLESVRRAARETLQNMMLTLGPTYLHLLLAEMLPLLQRGFQAHVLVFTVHGVLNCLKEHYKPNDVDKVLLTVLKLCNTDLFGILSEEKEIGKIRVKTSEAKSSKSLDTYQILAQFINEKCLMDLLLPIKRVLESSSSFKTAYKAQECLRCIAVGLVDNTFISTESLLKFAYGIASEKIPQLIPSESKQELTEKEIDLLKRQKPDCYIIPKAPVGRAGIRVNNVKNFDKANAHILVEFGLKVCFILLKRDRLKEEEFKPFMDPFVVLFKDCLRSKHVKVCTVTLQCLNWILKYELPSLKEHIKKIASDMFSILHKYASAGLSKGDNFDLVVAAFKAISILLRDVKYHTIEQDQLKVLLLYVEQDMNDYDRQAVAFNLLKAILTRKLIVPEIHEIMERVAELSIISELNHVRNQARSAFHQFLMDYPLGKKLEKHISFYLSQISFEMQYGRESAIEMIQTLINSFPLKTLCSHSGTIFITLGARLVNEDVPELRKSVAACLTSMLNRLPKADRQPLFEMVMLWFADKNISHRRLAAQLCGIFVNVEKMAFETRLPIIIPVMMKQFGMDHFPGKFMKLNNKDEENESEEKTRIRDHHYFQVLQLLLKLCAQCPNFLKKKETINNFASHCQSLLNYPHDWVRLSACQFLGFVLSSTDVDHLSNLLLTNEQDDSGYLTNNPVDSLKSLVLDLCDQLQPEDLKSDLAEQVIKNLVFVARVLQKIPIKTEDSNKINLYWLCKKLRKIINSEIVQNSSSIIVRTEIFKWIAGVTSALELEALTPILYHLMAPLVREMLTTEESNAPLRQLSKEVANIIKKKVGFEVYTEKLSKLQQSLSVKRAERKRSRNQLAVVDPELHAKKKIKRNEKKKDVKKRKIAEMKGVKKNFKKRKVDELEDNSEVL